MASIAIAGRLSELLRQHETAILERWVSRVREASRYRDRPEEELRHNARETLNAIADSLAGGGGAALHHVATALARQRHGSEIAQADVLHAMLLGREAILDECRARMEAAEIVAAGPALDEVFDRIISGFSSSFCSLCRDSQEERRARIERQLESVVDRSLDAIVFFDEDRRVRVWNPGAERLFGWSAEEMIGASLDRILLPDSASAREIDGALRGLGERGHVRLPEARRRRADGGLVWVDVSYTAVRDRDGRTAGIWAVFRDIGERKRLEEENLQAERLALIGTMSAKLAHEVRNPLNSLVLGLDLIRDNLRTLECSGGETVHETQDLIGSIESEMQRIQKVVEHYLQFARLPTLSMKSLDLDAALRAHLEVLRPELESRRIRLFLHLEAGGTEIRADEAQLWQAVLNLVRNSMESMPEGGVLTVTTRLAGDRLECEIRDTGSGMTEEVRSRIFRPFFSTKRAGTGLGMPLAQQILTEHGGTIACESAPGAGTRFTLALPLAGGAKLAPEGSA